MNNRQRFLIIVQLCFAFSLILWFSTQPFMGEYFTLRSRMLLYEFVMGNSDILINQKNQSEKLFRNSERFKKLDLDQQESIKEGYRTIQAYAQRPAFTKILDGIKVLFLRIPAFQLAWIFFAVVIGVMLLLNKPGARQAAWILPLITLIYAIDNYTMGHPALSDPDTILFPSEKVIMHDYLDDKNISNLDRDQLQEGWNKYLVVNWSTDSSLTAPEKLENAEFNFTTARLMLLSKELPDHWLEAFYEKSSYFLLSLYLIWNLIFAWSMRERTCYAKTIYNNKPGEFPA